MDVILHCIEEVFSQAGNLMIRFFNEVIECPDMWFLGFWKAVGEVDDGDVNESLEEDFVGCTKHFWKVLP